MSKYTWLIDPGHGGIDENGKYTTAPSKMYTFEDGFTIYEGVFNRKVAIKLKELLDSICIDYRFIVHPGESKDIPLKERVEIADEMHKLYKNCIYLSIHGNAGKGKGYEVYTSIGQTKSDYIAEMLYIGFEKVFPERIARIDLTDGDKDKEAQFYVLRKTDCPAVLTESGFMDNRKEAEMMLSEDGINKIAQAHFEGIKLVEEIECH